MIKSYSIREYQSGDEEGIVELLELVFNGWPHFDLQCTPLEHWNWKYIDNPLSTFKIIKAESKDDNIVGCYHGVDLNVKIGDDILDFNNGADVAVHPDFRRMGIYNKMNESITKLRWNAGTKIVFWTTGNPILARSVLKPGRMKFPQVVSHFVRIRNVDLHVKMTPSDNAWIKKIGYRTLNIINNVFRKSSISLDESVTIGEISKFDTRINTFWEAISKDHSFIVERRQNYLNWRYCDPRGGDFHVLIAEEGGSLLGYCVFRINRYNEDYPRGYIVDLLTLPNRNGVSEALIQEAVDFFDGCNVNIIDCLAIRRGQLGNSLRKRGFVDSRSKQFLVVSMRCMPKEETEKYSHSFTMKKMHFVYGDLDAI